MILVLATKTPGHKGSLMVRSELLVFVFTKGFYDSLRFLHLRHCEKLFFIPKTEIVPDK